MIAVLSVVIFALLLALALAGHRIETLHRYRHVECIDRVIGAIGKSHDETLIRQLAERWDSVEEQVNLHLLARDQYRADGPSMPALWLHQQADQIKREEAERGRA